MKKSGIKIRLGEIAYARSGDKGSSGNVAVFARKAEDYERLREQLTEDVVKKFFDPLGVRKVTRYEAPNLDGLNFLLEGVLGEGGSRSLRIDAQGKTLGQAILELEIMS
jgi:hypothetical protein